MYPHVSLILCTIEVGSTDNLGVALVGCGGTSEHTLEIVVKYLRNLEIPWMEEILHQLIGGLSH